MYLNEQVNKWTKNLKTSFLLRRLNLTLKRTRKHSANAMIKTSLCYQQIYNRLAADKEIIHT